MIILDPDPSTDAALTRSTSAYYWDAAGVLRQEAPNRLRVTYDPSDLTAPPYALIEPEGTNLLSASGVLTAAAWSKSDLTASLEPDAAQNLGAVHRAAASATTSTHSVMQGVSGTYLNDTWYTFWGFFKPAGLSQVRLGLFNAIGGVPGRYASFDLTSGEVVGTDSVAAVSSVGDGWYMCSLSAQVDGEGAHSLLVANFALMDATGATTFLGDGVSGILFGGAQLEQAAKASSYIPSVTAPTTRAADVLGAGTFVRSSVPESDYPGYSATEGYLVNDYVIDPTNHLVYASNKGTRSVVTLSIGNPCSITLAGHALPAGTPFLLSTAGVLPTGALPQIYYVLSPSTNAFFFSATVGGPAVISSGTQSGVHSITAGNVGVALTDTTAWRKVGATNARRMVDQYNNTQTVAPDEIVVVLRALNIAQGLYLGNMEGVNVDITAVDPVKGLIYTETRNQVVADSESSFFKWFFRRLRRQNFMFTAMLPVYGQMLVTVRIRNPGALAKCGICVLGPLIDVGLSQYGLATEIKDYSTTKFNVDGTSETVERGYSRRMTVDITIPNSRRDQVEDNLISFKQKNVLYVGTYLYGSAIVYGKYGSFKNMLEYFSHSKCSLQINGTV